MKAVLTKLVEMTENGLTLTEELEILDSVAHDKVQGPFSNTKDLMKALKKAL